jgi:hypothetical protein
LIDNSNNTTSTGRDIRNKYSNLSNTTPNSCSSEGVGNCKVSELSRATCNSSSHSASLFAISKFKCVDYQRAFLNYGQLCLDLQMIGRMMLRRLFVQCGWRAAFLWLIK